MRATGGISRISAMTDAVLDPGISCEGLDFEDVLAL